MSLNVAVPLSAATTRYGSSSSKHDGGRRVDDDASDHVVGDVEQASHEPLVPVDPLCAHGVAIGRSDRRTLDDEPALGAGGHDHGVLHHLGLHQAEHLGTEVLGRSLQRSPPLAMGPPRRWTPSTNGEHTKISNCGRGSGRKVMSLGRSFTAISSRPRNAFVRTVASIRVRNARQIRSSSSDGTASSCSSNDWRRSLDRVRGADGGECRVADAASSACGSKRASKIRRACGRSPTA